MSDRVPTEMEERIARIFCTAIGEHDPDEDILGDPAWVRELTWARSAIRAMREPTKAMAVAGDETLENQMDSDTSSNVDGDRYEYRYLRSGSAGATWHSMIDAASPPQDSIHAETVAESVAIPVGLPRDQK